MDECMDDCCCLVCKQSFSEPADNEDEYDKLWCSLYKKYVAEDDGCGDWNC